MVLDAVASCFRRRHLKTLRAQLKWLEENDKLKPQDKIVFVSNWKSMMKIYGLDIEKEREEAEKLKEESDRKEKEKIAKEK